MDTILYKCTDFNKANLRFIDSPYNQFLLGTVTFFENTHKKRAFIDLFSTQRADFEEPHKCLLENIRYSPYESPTWRDYDAFKPYFEPVCDLYDYQYITKEETVLYDQNAGLLQLHFAHGNILYFANAKAKQSLAYILYRINKRTTRNLNTFFLTGQERSFLEIFASNGVEAFAGKYNTSIPDERKEYFVKTAQALLLREAKITQFSDQLIHQTAEIESRLKKLL